MQESKVMPLVLFVILRMKKDLINSYPGYGSIPNHLMSDIAVIQPDINHYGGVRPAGQTRGRSEHPVFAH